MIKNERHSHAAKMLARARELYKVYQNNLELAKYNLQVSRFDPYDRYSFHYKCEIKNCKYMINQLQKEIREWKQEIYKAQTEYHKAFGRDYLMENWIKADKTPKEYPIGTKFKSASGGHWIKTERGYKWCTGNTFPNVGGDYIGLVCLPNNN